MIKQQISSEYQRSFKHSKHPEQNSQLYEFNLAIRHQRRHNENSHAHDPFLWCPLSPPISTSSSSSSSLCGIHHSPKAAEFKRKHRQYSEAYSRSPPKPGLSHNPNQTPEKDSRVTRDDFETVPKQYSASQIAFSDSNNCPVGQNSGTSSENCGYIRNGQCLDNASTPKCLETALKGLSFPANNTSHIVKEKLRSNVSKSKSSDCKQRISHTNSTEVSSLKHLTSQSSLKHPASQSSLKHPTSQSSLKHPASQSSLKHPNSNPSIKHTTSQISIKPTNSYLKNTSKSSLKPSKSHSSLTASKISRKQSSHHCRNDSRYPLEHSSTNLSTPLPKQDNSRRRAANVSSSSDCRCERSATSAGRGNKGHRGSMQNCDSRTSCLSERPPFVANVKTSKTHNVIMDHKQVHTSALNAMDRRMDERHFRHQETLTQSRSGHSLNESSIGREGPEHYIAGAHCTSDFISEYSDHYPKYPIKNYCKTGLKAVPSVKPTFYIDW